MSLTLHTNLGDLKLELYCELAPKACTNFLALSASGAYTGTLFHRSIRKFMAQGGDPTGTGKGGSSVFGAGKYFEDELHESLKHDARGTISMASRGPNTNASQFFIAYAPAPHLNNINTVFGRVIAGEETLDAMEKVPVDAKDRPMHEIKILDVTIHANPFAEAAAR